MTKRDDPQFDELAWQSLAVRAGVHRTPEGEHSEPIFTTSSYVFDSAAHAAARFAGDEAGNVYSRYTNPTVRTFEERLAALEGAEACVATASGMSAILSTCMAHLKAGDHVICSRDVFGTTRTLFAKYLTAFGVEVSFVPLLPLDGWHDAMRENTRLLYLETPSNPLCEVADIAAMADIAGSNSALLVVDNCFCTPALQQPLALGADIVIHSATKFLDGQGRCVGGAALGAQGLMDEVTGFLRSCGPTMSAFNAWVFLKGLETLSLRMQAHSASAQALAHWLQEQPAVEAVFYAGLASHPGHALAAKQQRAFGGVLSFRVRSGGKDGQEGGQDGGQEEAWRVIDSTRLMSLTANLGDAKTTIVHPATTTHSRISPAERLEAGITDNLIRVAVGLEDVVDLQADLARGLATLS